MIDEITDIELDSVAIPFSLKTESVVKNCKFVNHEKCCRTWKALLKIFPSIEKLRKKNRKHRETQLLFYPVLTSLLPTRLPPGIALIPNSMEEKTV